jgi:hypothetical protein
MFLSQNLLAICLSSNVKLQLTYSRLESYYKVLCSLAREVLLLNVQRARYVHVSPDQQFFDDILSR